MHSGQDAENAMKEKKKETSFTSKMEKNMTFRCILDFWLGLELGLIRINIKSVFTRSKTFYSMNISN